MRKKGMLYRIVVLAFIAGGFAGCVKSGTNSNNNSNTVTFLTLMNLTSSPADIYLNGTLGSQTALPAGFFDSRYEQLVPGAYDMQFKLGGTDSVLADIPNSAYDTLNYNTVILYNQIGGTAKAVKIADDFSTLSTSSASYRFFNMCPDAPSVDVSFNGIAVQSGRTTGDNAANGNFNSFQPANPGSYSVLVKKAGTDSVIASSNGVFLGASTATTIFLMGHAGNTTSPISIGVLVASN